MPLASDMLSCAHNGKIRIQKHTTCAARRPAEMDEHAAVGGNVYLAIQADVLPPGFFANELLPEWGSRRPPPPPPGCVGGVLLAGVGVLCTWIQRLRSGSVGFSLAEMPLEPQVCHMTVGGRLYSGKQPASQLVHSSLARG